MYEKNKTKVTSFKNRKHKKALPLEIEKAPQSTDKAYIYEFIRLDNEFYVFDYYNFKGDLQSGLGIILFSIILYFIMVNNEIPGSFFIMGLVFMVGLSFIIKLLFFKEKKLIMDRLNNLFSYPNYYSNTPVVVPFDETLFISITQGKMGTPTLMSPYTNWKINGFIFAIVNVSSV